MIQFEVKGSVRGQLQDIKRLQQELAKLPQDAYNFFVKTTPIDTGNARKNTKLKQNTIEANYPYAERLDRGWSRQANDGMTKPTEKFIKERLRKIQGK